VDSPRFRAGGEELDLVDLVIDSCKLFMTFNLDIDRSGEGDHNEKRKKKKIQMICRVSLDGR
jgi:hypothetical protein